MARITTDILCEYANVRDNLLNVLSGSITRMLVPTFPTRLGLMLALVVEIPHEERQQAHEITVVLKHNESARDVSRITIGVQVEESDAQPGESLFMPVVADLRSAPINAFGSYDIRANADGNDGPHLTVYIAEGS